MATSIKISDAFGRVDCFPSIRAAAVDLLGDQFNNKSLETCRIAIKRFAMSRELSFSEESNTQMSYDKLVPQELIDEAAYIRANDY